MTEERQLQKQIAEEAQVDPNPTAASPVVRAFQFFLVPLLIVGACVLVYSVLNWVVANPRSAREWLVDIKEGGRNTRTHAALQLVQTLRRMDKPDLTLTPDIIAVFKATPEEPDPSEFNIHRLLATCLGFQRDPLACDLLVETVSTFKNMETRMAAMDALGTIKDPKTLAPLVKLLDDPDAIVRKYAAFNAGAVAEKAGGEARGQAVEAIRRKLTDPSTDVTWNAAFALAYFLDDPSGADLLKKLLDRKYLGEKIGADQNAEALTVHALKIGCSAAGKLQDASFIPLLKSLTDVKAERDVEVRFAAHQAINRIQEKK